MNAVNEQQTAVRRRALGRRLIQKGTSLSNLRGDLNGSPDLQFFTDPERKAYDKQMEVLGKVMGNLKKLGERLEGTE